MRVQNTVRRRARAVLGALAVVTGLGAASLGAAQADVQSPRSNLRYDFDYPDLDYTQTRGDNPISRLQEKLEKGQVQLVQHGPRGYLESLLKELHIDKSSQVLIYAKTSLQVDYIDVRTPRAIYFNDTTYVASVVGSPLMEIATVDPTLGVMFYTLTSSQQGPKPHFTREAGRCLNCHDTYSMMGGGTPRVVVTSAPVVRADGTPPNETSSLTTDRSPLIERWGGWYVTGSTGGRPHAGNLPLEDPRQKPGPLSTTPPKDLQSLSGIFDTSTYLTDKSDVVALMVLEHQTNVQNMMVRAAYKARTAVKRVMGEDANPQTWQDLPEKLQKAFIPLVEPLSQAVLMEGVIHLDAPVTGSSGFDRWFQSQGPRDPRGRSLRELDLETRVFRYPLSYQLYTEAWDGMPSYIKDYVYTRVEKTLQANQAPSGSLEDRRAAYEILLATKPDFAEHARGGPRFKVYGPAADNG